MTSVHYSSCNNTYYIKKQNKTKQNSEGGNPKNDATFGIQN